MGGYAMDDIVTDGRWTVGWGTVVGTGLGMAGGALVGGGIGWLVPR